MGLWNKTVLAGTRAYFKRQVKKRPLIPLSCRNLDSIRRILLVSNTAIGDTLLSTPAIRAVKKSYPDRHVGLVCDARYQSLVHRNPHIDQIHLSRSKFYGMKSLIRELRDVGYDVAVILHGNDPESVPMCYLAGTETIIGMGTSKFRFLTSDPVDIVDPFLHTIERRLELVRRIGAEAHGVHMDLVTSPETDVAAAEIVRRHLGNIKGPLVGLHPAGSGSYKWWPWKRFVEIADRLTAEYEAGFIVFCGAREADLGDSIARAIRAPSFATNGLYDLSVVAGMLKQCDLLVTTDSGPMHMGFSLEVPTLALIGADHPARIGPYRVGQVEVLYRKEEVCAEPKCTNRKCPDNVCLKAIEVDDVWERISTRFRAILNNGRTKEIL
ncbi:MAG: glycosyltransferase family 9 protein [Deltaproteobacteria bacterium]|nr:glycosyltransferase family 9 protein [Deltaproteobacteria bacterium]